MTTTATEWLYRLTSALRHAMATCREISVSRVYGWGERADTPLVVGLPIPVCLREGGDTVSIK
jgi:hypothetical protein